MTNEKPPLAELAKVPQILSILGLSGDQIKQVIDASKTEAYKGKFFGEIAALEKIQINGKAVTMEDVEAGLRNQSNLIAQAAVSDIESIANSTQLTFPPFLQPHWGNGGKANDVSEPITKDTAASAAANLAKLIVLLVKDNPEAAKSAQEGVIAANNLTNYILEGNSETITGDKIAQVEGWLEVSKAALVTAATPHIIKDIMKGKEPQQPLYSYVNNRFAEIIKGTELVKTIERSVSVKDAAETSPKKSDISIKQTQPEISGKIGQSR